MSRLNYTVENLTSLSNFAFLPPFEFKMLKVHWNGISIFKSLFVFREKETVTEYMREQENLTRQLHLLQ